MFSSSWVRDDGGRMATRSPGGIQEELDHMLSSRRVRRLGVLMRLVGVIVEDGEVHFRHDAKWHSTYYLLWEDFLGFVCRFKIKSSTVVPHKTRYPNSGFRVGQQLFIPSEVLYAFLRSLDSSVHPPLSLCSSLQSCCGIIIALFVQLRQMLGDRECRGRTKETALREGTSRR